MKFKLLSCFIISIISLPAHAGELGVSHSVSSSIKNGTGRLTVNSVKNIQVNEQSVSFSGQFSSAQFDYISGQASIPNNTLSLGGTIGDGALSQISGSIGFRKMKSTETMKTNLSEHYSFSDSSFNQTSSTFSQ